MTDPGSGFRFVHCADLHLDSPFDGIREFDPHVASALRDATFRAFDHTIELAVREQVDLFLVAGDVYDAAAGSLQAQLRFRDALNRLQTAGIACCLAHGKSDPEDAWSVRLPLAPASHRFAAGKAERWTLERDGQPLVDVYGTSFPTRGVSQNFARQFRRDGAASHAIGMLHGNVDGDPRHADQVSCSVDDLVRAGPDYWALGHNHEPQVLQEAAPTIVYAGCVQSRSIRELGPRGCFLVHVDAAGVFHPQFVATDTIRWFDHALDIGTFHDLPGLFDRLGDLREEIRSAADGRAALIRLRLTGSGGLHAGLQHEETAAEVAGRLRESQPQRPDFVWLASLDIRTRPPIDVEQRRQVDDFMGDFLRTATALRGRDDAAGAVRQLLLERPEHATVRAEIDAMSETDLLAVLDEAVSMGLDHLLLEAR